MQDLLCAQWANKKLFCLPSIAAIFYTVEFSVREIHNDVVFLWVFILCSFSRAKLCDRRQDQRYIWSLFSRNSQTEENPIRKQAITVPYVKYQGGDWRLDLWLQWKDVQEFFWWKRIRTFPAMDVEDIKTWGY